MAPGATIDPDAHLEGPCFIGRDARIEAGAQVSRYAVVGASSVVGVDATLDGAILWPGSVIGRGAVVHDAILGRNCRVDDHAHVGPGAVLEDGTVINTDIQTP